MSYQVVETALEMQNLASNILSYKDIAIGADLETTGLDWMLNKILLFQLYVGEEIYIVDVRKLGYDHLTDLVRYIESSGNTLIFHNAKFDVKFIFYATKILLTHLYDTMIAEAVLVAGKGKMYCSLAELAEKYTDYFMDKSKRSEFIDFPDDKPFTETMFQYAALDVKVLSEIRAGQLEVVEKTFQTAVVDLENKLLPVVAKMEIDGIRLNAEQWLDVERKAVEKRDELTTNLKNMIVEFATSLPVENGLKLAETLKVPVTGKARRAALESVTDISLIKSWLFEHFNVKSSYQMKAVLHLMKIPVKDTNEKTLTDYADREIIKLLLSIREVNKQIDSYGRNVIELIHPVTGKIHTEYNTVGARTGRFSSEKPNMQNVPKSGGYRECFYPDEGYLFAAVDYSQQEYRLSGAVSRDPVIIQAYKNGSDMHTATAQLLYGKNEVTKEERAIGKTVNFAILYGSTEWGLKHNLDISLEEAKKIIHDFWDGYKNLSRFMKIAGDKILELGYSCTPIGRRRYNLAKPLYLNSKEFVKWQERVLREGRNFIIQGGGADMLKIAMVEIFARNPFGDNLKLCLQIHDELIAQVHESIKDEGLQFIKSVMEEVESRFLGEIPSKTDGELKERWSK
jgi:DNA polymerase I